MISIQVFGIDEVVFRLDQIPRQLRAVLRRKFETIFAELSAQFFEGTPGRFLDPKQIQTGIAEIGSQVVGYIEYTDKDGLYAIYPSKANLLRFIGKNDGALVFAPVVAHPYPKGTSMIERHLRDSKPWIVEQLQDAFYEIP